MCVSNATSYENVGKITLARIGNRDPTRRGTRLVFPPFCDSGPHRRDEPMPVSPRKSALTIGRLLNLLRASETQVIEGQRLQQIAEAGPAIKGSREESAFISADRHFQKAEEYQAQLDNYPNIDALRAKSAADTGQSFLLSN